MNTCQECGRNDKSALCSTCNPVNITPEPVEPDTTEFEEVLVRMGLFKRDNLYKYLGSIFPENKTLASTLSSQLEFWHEADKQQAVDVEVIEELEKLERKVSERKWDVSTQPNAAIKAWELSVVTKFIVDALAARKGERDE